MAGHEVLHPVCFLGCIYFEPSRSAPDMLEGRLILLRSYCLAHDAAELSPMMDYSD